MVTLNRSWSVQRCWAPYRVILPAVAGGIMLIASLLPWLVYPTGRSFFAWQLVVDTGWQLSWVGFNYGVLCLSCACYAFYIAYKAWRMLPIEQHGAVNTELFVARRQPPNATRNAASRAALLCLLPSLLFLFQYLFVDMGSIAVLTRQELQLLLVKLHFDYAIADQFMPIQSLAFNTLSFSDRLALMLDNVGIGLFLPLVSAWLLLLTRNVQHREATTVRRIWGTERGLRYTLGTTVALLALLALGRGPAALACTYQAEQLLSAGNYDRTLQWLDAAHLLNPALDELAAYHIERGQAWYFLHPRQPNLESQVYLAAYYRQQNDLLSSYQELMGLWQRYPHVPWLTDEISLSIERLAELSKPLTGQQAQHLTNNTPALPWLSQLQELDPTNIYARYTIGRIFCDAHDYTRCEIQMRSVLALSTLDDVQSSAYTYMAFSEVGLGANSIGREYLFKAQNLDPEYRNNTARQDMSGLR